jgi:hypothetical protein
LLPPHDVSKGPPPDYQGGSLPDPSEVELEGPFFELYGNKVSLPPVEHPSLVLVIDKSGSMTLDCGTHSTLYAPDMRGVPGMSLDAALREGLDPMSVGRRGYVSRWAVAVSEFDRLVDSLPENFEFSAMVYENVPADWDPVGFGVLSIPVLDATPENKARAKAWIRGTAISPFGGTDTRGAMRRAFRYWATQTDDFVLETDGEPTFAMLLGPPLSGVEGSAAIEATRVGVPASRLDSKDKVHCFGIYAQRNPVFERMLLDIAGATGGKYFPVH